MCIDERFHSHTSLDSMAYFGLHIKFCYIGGCANYGNLCEECIMLRTISSPSNWVIRFKLFAMLDVEIKGAKNSYFLFP